MFTVTFVGGTTNVVKVASEYQVIVFPAPPSIEASFKVKSTPATDCPPNTSSQGVNVRSIAVGSGSTVNVIEAVSVHPVTPSVT